MPDGLWRPPILSPAIIGPQKGRRLYLSGIAPIDDEGTLVAPGNMKAQVKFTFRQLARFLDKAAIRPEHICKVTHVFVDFQVSDLDYLFAMMPSVFRQDCMPTSTGITVPMLRHAGQRYELVCEGTIPESELPSQHLD